MFQVSFILPEDTVPGRMGLLVILFLCMVNILNSEASYSPKSGGAVTAIIQWILSCSVFIILAILEYGLILYYKKYNRTTNIETHSIKHHTQTSPIKQPMNSKNEYKTLDMCMIAIFPGSFSVFTTIFWWIQYQKNI